MLPAVAASCGPLEFWLANGDEPSLSGPLRIPKPTPEKWDGIWGVLGLRSELGGVCILVLLALLVGFIPTRAAADAKGPSLKSRSSWEFTSFLEGSGLARRFILDVAFETNSTAWIAASDGLYRYDGYSWRSFTTKDGLPSDFVRSVCVDNQGRIWIGTDQGVSCYSGRSFSSMDSEKKLAGRSVRRITQDPDGTLWFACDRWPDNSWEGGLSSLKQGVWKTYRETDGLPSDYVYNYFRDTKGCQYVFTARGTARKSGERWVPMDEPGFPAEHHGNLMVESGLGVAFVQLREKLPPPFRKDGRWQTAPGGGTGPLCATRQGEVFNVAYQAQTKDLCIQKWTGQRFEAVSLPVSCLYGTVEAMAEAPDGSIWCVGPEVVLRWEPTGGEWSSYEGLPPVQLVDARQRVWFADTTRAWCFSRSGWEPVPGFQGRLARDSAGTVWSWSGETITEWAAGGPVVFNASQTGLREVKNMLGDGRGRAWFYGTNAQGGFALAVHSPEGWVRPPIPEFGERGLDAAAADAQSGVWLLANRRRETPLSLVHVSLEVSNAWYEVPSATINYRDSGLLVNSRGVWLYGSSGLYHLTPATRAWTRATGLLGNNVYSALSDAGRSCFLFDGRSGGGSGYVIFEGGAMRQFRAEVEWSCFGGHDGTFYIKEEGGFLIVPPGAGAVPFHLALPEDTIVSNVVQGASNSLWLTSSKAVLHYQPNADLPKTFLAECDQRVRKGDAVRLQMRGAKRWAPHCPQTAFLFSWRVDHGEWSPFQPPPPRGIPTTGLAPGLHRLGVRSLLDGMKAESTPAEVQFVLAPIPLQERRWFPATVIGLFTLLLLLAASALWARHKLALSANQLEKMVKDRTQQLVQSNQSLQREIDERKSAEAEKERLQGQLLQAQKIESIGRLAGGIAHDFNNMLQVILGNVALSLEREPAPSEFRSDLLEIQSAAERSAELTRQLLAFARKQTVNPKVLDLNTSISGMLKMLGRLVGEDIRLVWSAGKDLRPIEIDPAQVDQILANLTVNARDAIRGVGKITIETANVSFDAISAHAHPDCLPRAYVQLAVSDTGCGMDEETLSHIFEPFFTTKGLGEGTGLGLATVYGIVRQNGGFISVESRKGLGSCFRLYLPTAQEPASPAAAAASPGPRGGAETVMLVEDEEQILHLGRRVLEKHGYTVLAAPSPEAALNLARHHAGFIHLLVTDVVMPGMNGRELRDRLAVLKPGLRCLFMSGYTAEVIAHQNVLDEGIQFLPKPFNIEDLARRVRDILDSPRQGNQGTKNGE